MKVLVFDTETTGLPERNASFTETNLWPHVIQLSYVLYETDTGKILEHGDNIINLPKDVEISEKSIEIHGIDRKKSNGGILIKDAIQDFNNMILKCDMIVGHNISFDKKMISVECIRLKTRQYFNVYGTRIKEFCTMKGSTKLCNILKAKTNGNTYLKFPTLCELHNHLFGYNPENLHNSMIDVLVCMKCFHKIKFDEPIECSTFNMLLTGYNNDCDCECEYDYDEQVSHGSSTVEGSSVNCCG